MFQGNKFLFQWYKTFQYFTCTFLFMLAQICDILFSKNTALKGLCKHN